MSAFGLLEKRVIGRRSSPLMTRWTLLRTPWFTVKVHRFHRSDPSCLHDHPWPFVSLILVGGYWEENTLGEAAWYGPGHFLVRSAEWKHRVILGVGADHRSIEPLTLVITGRRVREWGFWTKALGWIPWFNFTDSVDDC